MTINNSNNSCWNDFTVRNGASGGIRKIRVQNENNTAGSSAAVEAYVQGTTAADAYFRSVIGAAHSYAAGIDTSNTERWKLTYSADSTATPSSATSLIEASKTGILSFPLQSRVGAYKSAASANVTGDNTEYKVVFDTEQYDIQSEYDTATGEFTAKETGIYEIDTTILISNLGAAHTSGLVYLYQNISVVGYFQFGPYQASSAAGGTLSYHFCRKLLVNSGDVLYVTLTVAGGTKTVGVLANPNATNFHICKIA